MAGSGVVVAVPKFEISNLHNDPSEPRLWWAEVRLNFDEEIGESLVTHWVTVKIRATADESVNVRELREILFRKAVEQLHQASQAVEGKTARELLDAAHEEYVVQDRHGFQ